MPDPDTKITTQLATLVTTAHAELMGMNSANGLRVRVQTALSLLDQAQAILKQIPEPEFIIDPAAVCQGNIHEAVAMCQQCGYHYNNNSWYCACRPNPHFHPR